MRPFGPALELARHLEARVSVLHVVPELAAIPVVMMSILDEQTTPINEEKVNVPLTFKGFAHDPASGTTNTAQIGGVVQLVSGSQIVSTLPVGSNDKIAAGQRLFIKFVPEPGMLLLIGSGAAGLALLGRKRMRK